MSELNIALFVFNRPNHTRRMLESLLANEEVKRSNLTVFSDGPRRPEDEQGIHATRALFKNLTGFRSVKLVTRDENWGLAKSIIFGVTEVVQQYGRVIVLEDDLVLSPFFLKFMHDGLNRYENCPEVASIHGYSYPCKAKLPETFFLRGADCWGWATWARAWKHFEPDGQKLLANLESKKLTKLFDLNDCVRNTDMLRDQIAGRNNSWAIRWHASTFLKNMLTLYPGVSLVNNSGHDGSGVHCESTQDYQTNLSTHPIYVEKLTLVESVAANLALQRYYRSIKRSILTRIVMRVRKLLSQSKKATKV